MSTTDTFSRFSSAVRPALGWRLGTHFPKRFAGRRCKRESRLESLAKRHRAAIVEMGGPLGKTKKVSERGIEDITNLMSAYTIVRADSHDAAAKLFEDHPHFTNFPGNSVEVMPVLPIPTA